MSAPAPSSTNTRIIEIDGIRYHIHVDPPLPGSLAAERGWDIVKVRRCAYERCQKTLETQPTYCDDACRWGYHNQQRKLSALNN